MLRLAITGGLCSGKSTVANRLRQLGCPVIDADAVGRALLQGAAKPALVAEFGQQIVDEQGAVNAARLAALAFGPESEAARTALNRIMHPLIQAAMARELAALEARGEPVAAVEAALIIETGSRVNYDRLLLVVADAELRLSRFVESRGDRQQALDRMAAQLPDSKKIQYADWVIENNGSRVALERQVDAVWEKLR
ncbi:MAG TPA: dephospho-CoA kinase [Terriglobales bacterium]|nr:dephospho-CoA kinase [Terriglobales bacterium]